jgi:hypothetical protein
LAVFSTWTDCAPCREERNQGKEGKTLASYLIAVHFEFPDDLDGHLAILRCGILGAVDVAESAIAHLFHQDPAIQTRVFGHFGSTQIFFCDQAFNLSGAILPDL